MLDEEHKRYSSIPCMKLSLIGDLVSMHALVSAQPEVVGFVYKKSGDTPLLLAARHGHTDLLEFLIERGVNVEHRNNDLKRAMHEACFSGVQRSVEILSAHGAQIDPLKHGDWTPLMIASAQGHADVVRTCINLGADAERVNKDGWNSFHLACRGGHLDVARLLVSVKSVHNHSKNLRTPLHTACMHGQEQVVEFLLDTIKNLPIEVATPHQETDGYNTLLNVQDSCGSTPFMDAIRFNFVSVARLLAPLVSTGIRDKLGRTCLHVAAQSGAHNAFEYLLVDCQLDVDDVCSNSASHSAHLAAKEGHVSILESIVRAGGRLNTLDSNDRTALHLASATNRRDVVEFLLKSYSIEDIQRRDVDCKLAFDYALNELMKDLFRDHGTCLEMN